MHELPCSRPIILRREIQSAMVAVYYSGKEAGIVIYGILYIPCNRFLHLVKFGQLMHPRLLHIGDM